MIFILKLLKIFSFVPFVSLRFENNFIFSKREIMLISVNNIVRNNAGRTEAETVVLSVS